MIKIVNWSASRPQGKVVTRFLQRSAFPEEAEKAAAEVLAAIRAEGDAAVARYVAKFEGAKLSPKRFRVGKSPALHRAKKRYYDKPPESEGGAKK